MLLLLLLLLLVLVILVLLLQWLYCYSGGLATDVAAAVSVTVVVGVVVKKTKIIETLIVGRNCLAAYLIFASKQLMQNKKLFIFSVFLIIII